MKDLQIDLFREQGQIRFCLSDPKLSRLLDDVSFDPCSFRPPIVGGDLREAVFKTHVMEASQSLSTIVESSNTISTNVGANYKVVFAKVYFDVPFLNGQSSGKKDLANLTL